MLNKKHDRFNMPQPGGFNVPMNPPFNQLPIGPGPGPGPFIDQIPETNQMNQNIQLERLQVEIIENRRRIDQLSRRVTRIENFLRLREQEEMNYFNEFGPDNFSY